MIEFLPGLPGPGHHRATQRHAPSATDGQTEWWIDLDAVGSAVSGHAKANGYSRHPL